MDFIDNLIYTANTDNVRGQYPWLLSDFASTTISQPGVPGRDENTTVPPSPLPTIGILNTYPLLIRENFIFYEDLSVIDKAVQKHWFDMANGPVNVISLFDPVDAPPYHIIYAYLIENTRIVQILERLIYLYQHDEILGIASANVPAQQQAFQWINNTENLFFKTLSNTSYRNISGNLRPSSDSNRRNAYYRFFGMDLAFGDSNNMEASYYKAKTANNEFILLFEEFLAENWQAYTNANNTSGANTTDFQRIMDMAMKIRQMLMARRGASGNISLQNYKFMNLSKEEYASVGMLSWLFFIISYDSPLVNFLGCQANTASERLMNIGKKVGIVAHKKAQALIDMAAPMAAVLRLIEFGNFEMIGSAPWIREVIESQKSGSPASPAQKAVLIDLLTIINNWEKATGHRIKNPEANIRGNVTLQQNGSRVSTNGNMPKPAMN